MPNDQEPSNLTRDALLAEIERLRADNARLEAIARSAGIDARRAVKNQLSNQLGELVIENRRKPHKWPLLPFLMYQTARRHQARTLGATGNAEVAQLVADGKAFGATDAVRRLGSRREKTLAASSTITLSAAKLSHEKGDSKLAAEFVAMARKAATDVKSLRAVFWAANSLGLHQEACQSIVDADAILLANPNTHESNRLASLKTKASYQLTLLTHAHPRESAPKYSPVANRVAYVLHNSLPYSSGGYATRSHGVALGLTASNLEVIAFTRPGFPVDVKSTVTPEEVALSEVMEGVTYIRSLTPSSKGTPLVEYILKSADILERQFAEYLPSVVIAASNYRIGLMAMIAARRLGIPVIYEVRGWWEITRLSRDPSFRFTESYEIQRLMEVETAKAADHVLTLTKPMREDLIRDGLLENRVTLLPNSCNPTRFEPRARSLTLAAELQIPKDVLVIGYIGTFVDYEGLDDLARACGELKKRGIKFRLLIVGNEDVSGSGTGPITSTIRSIADAAGFTEWLVMPGRVPYESVSDYYSLIDVAAFPRKPWQVCELVSPMKPLEALAMQKAVVVSSVRALDEMISNEQTGLVYQKGDNVALANALERLLVEPGLAEQLATQGRQWVLAERTWEKSVADALVQLPETKFPPQIIGKHEQTEGIHGK